MRVLVHKMATPSSPNVKFKACQSKRHPGSHESYPHLWRDPAGEALISPIRTCIAHPITGLFCIHSHPVCNRVSLASMSKQIQCSLDLCSKPLDGDVHKSLEQTKLNEAHARLAARKVAGGLEPCSSIVVRQVLEVGLHSRASLIC
jgi:hypothetical protein